MNKSFLPVECTSVFTHVGFHLDELFALWFLQNTPEGEQLFPGVSKAKLGFFDGNGTPDGRTWQEWAKDGCILLGRGGGPFDEHPVGNEPRKKGCCASLVAEALGIDDRPEYQFLLREVTKEDNEAGSPLISIPTVIKRMHEQKVSPEKIIKWANTGIQALVTDQLLFHTITRADFKECASIDTFVPALGRFVGKRLPIAVIESRNKGVSRFARSKYGVGAAVVIQRDTDNGNTIVLTSKRYHLPMHEVVRTFRVAEGKLLGHHVADWGVLSQEGLIEGWYFQEQGGIILNGGNTAPNVEPSKLTLPQLVALLKVTLEAYFPEERRKECESGMCTSTLKSPCNLYMLGLSRCRTIRHHKQ